MVRVDVKQKDLPWVARLVACPYQFDVLFGLSDTLLEEDTRRDKFYALFGLNATLLEEDTRRDKTSKCLKTVS